MNYKTVNKYSSFIPATCKTFRTKMAWLKANFKSVKTVVKGMGSDAY